MSCSSARDHQPVAVRVVDPGRAGRPRAAWRRRAGGSARARRPRRRALEEVEGLGARRSAPGRRRGTGPRPPSDAGRDRGASRRRLLASRRTEITSATSDSTAATISADRGPVLADERGAGACATRRAPETPPAPRTQPSAGGRGPRCDALAARQRSAASPWCRVRDHGCAPCALPCAACWTSAIPTYRQPGRKLIGAVASAAVSAATTRRGQRRVDPAQRLVPSRAARASRICPARPSSRDRHADRLEDVLRA